MDLTRRDFVKGILGLAGSFAAPPVSLAQTTSCINSASVLSTDSLTAIAAALNDIQAVLAQADLLNVPEDPADFYENMVDQYQKRGAPSDELAEASEIFTDPPQCKSIFNRKPEDEGICEYDEVWKIETFHKALIHFPPSSDSKILENLTDKELYLTLMGHLNYVYLLTDNFPEFSNRAHLPGKITEQLNLIGDSIVKLEEKFRKCLGIDPAIQHSDPEQKSQEPAPAAMV